MLDSTICDASARPGERTISIGVTMFRSPGPFLATVLGIGVVSILVAGCGAAPTASPTVQATPNATATPPPAQTPSPGPSGSVTPSAIPSATIDLGLPHVNAALEDKLPDTIGGVSLNKFSMPLSTYIASLKGGGDSSLYTPWLVKFGKTPDQVDLAVATDLTQTENIHILAIEVTGVDAAALSGGFADVARKKGWPVTERSGSALPKDVLEIIDQATNRATGLGTAYVFATGDVLYLVVTDDPSLLLESLIKLP